MVSALRKLTGDNTHIHTDVEVGTQMCMCLPIHTVTSWEIMSGSWDRGTPLSQQGCLTSVSPSMSSLQPQAGKLAG